MKIYRGTGWDGGSKEGKGQGDWQGEGQWQGGTPETKYALK